MVSLHVTKTVSRIFAKILHTNSQTLPNMFNRAPKPASLDSPPRSSGTGHHGRPPKKSRPELRRSRCHALHICSDMMLSLECNMHVHTDRMPSESNCSDLT
jgi:hypothetical protein